MKVSAVLRECANSWLIRDPDNVKEHELCATICNALREAERQGLVAWESMTAARTYLHWLGMPNYMPGCMSAFPEFEAGVDRQAVRHAWLLQAARCWDAGVRP